jgi:hypothetical protein
MAWPLYEPDSSFIWYISWCDYNWSVSSLICLFKYIILFLGLLQMNNMGGTNLKNVCCGRTRLYSEGEKDVNVMVSIQPVYGFVMLSVSLVLPCELLYRYRLSTTICKLIYGEFFRLPMHIMWFFWSADGLAEFTLAVLLSIACLPNVMYWRGLCIFYTHRYIYRLFLRILFLILILSHDTVGNFGKLRMFWYKKFRFYSVGSHSWLLLFTMWLETNMVWMLNKEKNNAWLH